jgi:protein TonB
MAVSPKYPAPPSADATIRLFWALALSLAFHLSLILGLQVRPAAVADGGSTVMEVRLAPSAVTSQEPKPTVAEPAPEKQRVTVPHVEPPKPQAEERQKAAPAAPVAAPPSSALAAVDIPLIEDPTYYPAKQLDVLPQPVQSIKPAYPSAAEATDMGGQVKMLILIDERGVVQDISVVEVKPEGYGFEESAVEAFRNTRFSPAIRHGRPVKSRGIFVVTFDAGLKKD